MNVVRWFVPLLVLSSCDTGALVLVDPPDSDGETTDGTTSDDGTGTDDDDTTDGTSSDDTTDGGSTDATDGGSTDATDGGSDGGGGDTDVVPDRQDPDGDGFTAGEGDCAPEDGARFPGATETCNQVDDDCDEEVDEAGATGGGSFWPDADGDKFGDANATAVTACVAPAGFVSDNTDCFDGNPRAFPGAPGWFEVDRGDGSFDWNCDTAQEQRWTPVYACANGCWSQTVDGWIGAAAACGTEGTWGSGCAGSASGPSYCRADDEDGRTQACR